MYRNEIIVNASRPITLGLLTNPFLIAGITGHLAIIGVKDKQKGDYVKPEFLSSPERDFKVAYVFGGDENHYVSLGYLRGPEVTPGEVKYEGATFDGKFEVDVSFFLTPIGDSKTRIVISVNAKYKTSILSKLFGRSEQDLATHIVESHFIPFFKFFFKPSEEFEIRKIEIISEEGDGHKLLGKFKEVLPKLEVGVAKIYGNDTECSIVVFNRDIKRMTCRADDDVKSGHEALSLLLLNNGELKMRVYQLLLDDIMEKL